MQLLLLLSLIGLSLAIREIGSTQSVAVTGVLLCNGLPASKVKVKLCVRKRRFDMKLAEGVSNSLGTFLVSGSKREISNINPKVNLYHRCNYNGPCYREFGIAIPVDYITNGSTPLKTYNIGTINLANRFSGETIGCTN